MNWWNSLSEKTRWILFFPTTVLIMFFISILAHFTIPTKENNFITLIFSALNMVTFFWGIIHLPPRRNIAIGWGFFVALSFYIFYSISNIQDGRTTLGDSLPESTGSFWILQNFTWLVAGFISVLVFTRGYKKHQSP